MSSPLLVLIAVLAGAVACAFVPEMVGRLPEPQPPAADEADERARTAAYAEADPVLDADPLAPPEPKRPYAELARARGLRWWSVLAGAVAGGLCGLSATELERPGLLPALLVLVPVGVALAYVDARTRLLPSALIKPTYPLLVVLLVLGAALDGSWRLLLSAAIGWVVFGGLFLLLNLVYPAGMGYGDVRLSGLLGLVLGYAGLAPLLVGLESAFVLGAIGGLVPAVVRRVRRRPRVRGYPFGPYMLAGALTGLVAGEPLLVALMGGSPV